MTPAAPPTDTDPGPPVRLGVLAFGDSITNGGGELQWGVALQSWAMWTARGLGVPYTGYAADGARAGDVVSAQIPAYLASTARPGARYDVGCLYIGVNDVRGLDWDPARFAADHAAALRFLTERCDRVLCVTAPLALGLPPAGPKVSELNAVVVGAATAAGALVLDLADFGDRDHLMADRVHPTALGQVEIARRALRVLAGDGLRVRADPGALIDYTTTLSGRVRGRLAYGYREAKIRVGARWSAAAWRARERLRRAGGPTPR